MPTLLERLRLMMPTAKTGTLRRLASEGKVLVNGQPASRVNAALADDAVVSINHKPISGNTPIAPASESDVRAKSLAGGKDPSGIQVVYQDLDLIVVNKPPGLLTSTTPKERRMTLLKQIQKHVSDPAASVIPRQRRRLTYDARPQVGVIHRLDRDAQGLLVFSLNEDSFRQLKDQLFRQEIDREYHAVVHGIPKPPNGTIDQVLVERADGFVRPARPREVGMAARTHYQTLQSDSSHSLLKVVLETGRKHQIRVHMMSLGHPIMGDNMYGKPGENRGGHADYQDGDHRDGPLRLVATRLSLHHPRTGDPMSWEIPLPKGFWPV